MARQGSLIAVLFVVIAWPIAPATAQLEPARVSEVNRADALAGRRPTLVLVKDFMKIQNTGGLLPSVEFPRYLPVIDQEQIVAGRWIDARTSGGTSLPIDITSVSTDEAGNLIQMLRIRPMPPGQVVTVTLTTLVARRERPAPEGRPQIPAADQYPAEVRPYLASTPCIVVDHKVVRDAAAAILAKTHDPMGVAAEIARLATERTYLPSGGSESLPLTAGVLKHGGSCCASAAAAAAVFRACGIPAQITYCPPPCYVHGIVRFYVDGYGWLRMDATSGGARFPLVQGEDELTLVRVFDMPVQMEQQEIAYAWPYQNNDAQGPYRFFASGKPTGQVAMKQPENGELPFVQEPFPHLEPGSWSAVLGSEALDGAWADWEALVKAARTAATGSGMGPFEDLTHSLPSLKPYLDTAATWSRPRDK